jgi:S1-C subfamily serine protease
MSEPYNLFGAEGAPPRPGSVEEPLEAPGGGIATAVRDTTEHEPSDGQSPWQLPPAAGQGGGGGWGPWGAPAWAQPPPHPSRPHPLRSLAVGAVVVALVSASAALGFAIGRHHDTPGLSTASSASPSGGSASAGSGAGSGSSSSSGAAIDATQIAAKVDPAVVDVNTVLGYQNGEAAGTGVVLSADGYILTNNHVVEGSTSISVTDVGNGRTYKATVVGTDATDDVAVLSLSGASGLNTISLGSSSSIKVGDSVVAIGNAGGTGGTPSFSAGQVSAVGQSITASDDVSGTSEQLTGLVQTTATLQPGDSGGPLVDASGRMVAMDTAASSGFQFQSGSSENFAIPVDRAISIAKQIETGGASSTIHIGSAAFLGVQLQPVSSFSGTSSGAAVVGVVPGSPAESAGIVAGDVIDSVGAKSVDSADTLASIMEGFHPGDKVSIGWIDDTGAQQSATVQLATGPAA